MSELLPPSPFIRNVASEQPVSGLVVDVGCHTGRNSLYLAQLGHEVLGVTNDPIEAEIATKNARELNLADRCNFVVTDATNLKIADVSDTNEAGTILVNELLHLLPKKDSKALLRDLRDQTRHGGLHIVSGYLIDPKYASEYNRERCLRRNELANSYTAAGWDIRFYHEDPFLQGNFNGTQIINSLARIVARKS